MIEEIIRTNRRSLALIVTEGGVVQIRAPYKASMVLIREFINRNRLWIKKKQDLIKEKLQTIKPKLFIEGEKFLYEGNAYALLRSNGKNIQLQEALFFPSSFFPEAKRHLINWYKNMALIKIEERAKYYAEITRLKYKVVKITNARKRWGSCSTKGSININWRLIMAPPAVLDYVIVHELLHLAIKSHSKIFWDNLRVVFPGYKEQDSWLKQHGYTLVV